MCNSGNLTYQKNRGQALRSVQSLAQIRGNEAPLDLSLELQDACSVLTSVSCGSPNSHLSESEVSSEDLSSTSLPESSGLSSSTEGHTEDNEKPLSFGCGDVRQRARRGSCDSGIYREGAIKRRKTGSQSSTKSDSIQRAKIAGYLGKERPLGERQCLSAQSSINNLHVNPLSNFIQLL